MVTAKRFNKVSNLGINAEDMHEMIKEINSNVFNFKVSIFFKIKFSSL